MTRITRQARTHPFSHSTGRAPRHCNLLLQAQASSVHESGATGCC